MTVKPFLVSAQAGARSGAATNPATAGRPTAQRGRAFQISQQDKPPLPSLDGFTPDQQFFIAWGQFRGDAVRPEFARTMVQSDPHPIARYRVIGPVSTLPEFQKAFSCKADAPMVRPANLRCEVW